MCATKASSRCMKMPPPPPVVGLSGRVLGDDHPLKRKIVASFLKCFDEQLDWSLDDIPDDYLEYRALLLEGGCAAARRRGVR